MAIRYQPRRSTNRGSLGDHHRGSCRIFITNLVDSGEEKKDPPEPEVEASGDLPYRVVNTGQLGLIVRSCPDETCGCTGIDCEQLGAAADDTILWVVCQEDTEFVPAGLTEGPWYRIRWTIDSGGTSEIGAGESTVDAPHKDGSSVNTCSRLETSLWTCAIWGDAAPGGPFPRQSTK